MRQRLKLFAGLSAFTAIALTVYGCGGGSSTGFTPVGISPPPATGDAPPTSGSSKIARLQITSKVSPAFAGKTFGQAGAYEVLIGKLHGEADPNSPRNTDVTDIKGAPRNTAGRVEYSADVIILKPIDMSKSDGVLTYEVTNRGTWLAPAFVLRGNGDFTNAAGATRGLDQGSVFVWSGWQGDIPSTLTEAGAGFVAAQLPTAKQADGSPITGTVADEVVLDGSAGSMIPAIAANATSFDVPLSYEPVQADTSKLKLTVQQHADDVPVVLPAAQMDFTGPKNLRVQLASGYDLGAIYKISYTAKDPIVSGLGSVGIRDLLSFLRYSDKDDVGTPNPLAVDGRSVIRRTIGIGFSQSGRFLRDFIYHDFNVDEQGRKAFDGMLPGVAGAKRGVFTERFAQPGRSPDWQHEMRGYPGAQFPYTFATTYDPITDSNDGLFKRCAQSNTCPNVMQVDSETEQWQSFGSLVMTDAQGKAVVQPENVRSYVVGGTQHGGGVGSIAAGTFAANPVACQSDASGNPLSWGTVFLALYTDMRAWLVDGTLPPESRNPAGTSKGRLSIDALANAYPVIPGASFSNMYSKPQLIDFSSNPWKQLAAIANYPVSFLAIDGDGNARGAIELPEITVPVATYSGRANRAAGYAPGELCSTNGSAIPFAKTVAERVAKGDPRRSLAERYASDEDYRSRLKAAADVLVQERLLLAEDAARYSSYVLPK